MPEPANPQDRAWIEGVLERDEWQRSYNEARSKYLGDAESTAPDAAAMEEGTAPENLVHRDAEGTAPDASAMEEGTAPPDV